jgi:hypothetical protein
MSRPAPGFVNLRTAARNISCRTASYPCWANTSALKHGICTNLQIIIRMAYRPARPGSASGATEATQQREASDQAAQTLSISTTLYEDGLDSYLSVAVAQVQALAAQTAEVQLLARQMQASVSLIRALGGGWTVQVLPNEKQTLPFGPLDYGASAKQ